MAEISLRLVHNAEYSFGSAEKMRCDKISHDKIRRILETPHHMKQNT